MVLAGDAARQRQDRSSAWDESGGDQQQSAAFEDLHLGPRHLAGELRLALGAAMEPTAGTLADEVRGVVAEKRAERAGSDDQRRCSGCLDWRRRRR